MQNGEVKDTLESWVGHSYRVQGGVDICRKVELTLINRLEVFEKLGGTEMRGSAKSIERVEW